MKINTTTSLTKIRKFLMYNVKMPSRYQKNENIYPERYKNGIIYIQSSDKSTLSTINNTTFIHSNDVIYIKYHSKSKKTILYWQRKGLRPFGKLYGKASKDSVTNLIQAGINIQY